MKRVTLFTIIIFITIVGFLFVFSKYDQNNNKNINISTTKSKQKTTTYRIKAPPIIKSIPPKNKIETGKLKHLHSPNIDIIAIKKIFIRQQNGSLFSLADVSKHATIKDCYLAINGKVYNVTSYIPYHPGGSFIIGRYCGQEVTGIFAQIHSNRAWDLLRRYKIGVISTPTYNIISEVLSAIAKSLQAENPSATVIKVSPKNGMYIAKVFFDNKFYEVHINESGKIIKEEIAAKENWNKWKVDVDDN